MHRSNRSPVSRVCLGCMLMPRLMSMATSTRPGTSYFTSASRADYEKYLAWRTEIGTMDQER